MAKDPLSSRIRLTLLKGMEAIGTSASNLASNAKLKANEINLETRRHEILTNFSLRAFEMWQKGASLPEPLSAMFVELSEVDDRLSVLHAQRYAKVATPEPSAVKSDEAVPDSDTTIDQSADVTFTVSDTDSSAEESVPCELETTKTTQEASDAESTAEPAPSPEAKEGE